jgi:general L-amino acid transport system permease protein
MTTATQASQSQPPPSERATPIGWLLKNLFNTWYNVLLTLFAGWVTFIVVRGFLNWALNEARWKVIPANLRLFLVGQYPSAIEGQTDLVWRIGLVVYLITALAGLAFGVWSGKRSSTTNTLLAVPIIMAVGLVIYSFVAVGVPIALSDALGTAGAILLIDVIGVATYFIGKALGPRFSRILVGLLVLAPWIALFLIRGFGESYINVADPFAEVPSRFWGGLLLSMLLAFFGIMCSFPIGVVLALGRQSKQPITRTLSVLYIEFIRGVPLITLLFMGQVMLPLFLPQSMDPLDRVLRAFIAVTMFSAAYLAENVRAGLQSIPKGQYEAAHAIGLSKFQTMWNIILPQALRAVIPVIVGQFIGLFKDTTLVAIVGLLDLLGIARGVISNPDYIGTQREVFLFISLFYFVFSYALGAGSRKLETSLGVGER